MAHKGKAMSDITYNLGDVPKTYNNPSILPRLYEYTKVHGPVYDPEIEDIDGDVLMRVGGSKIHGR